MGARCSLYADDRSPQLKAAGLSQYVSIRLQLKGAGFSPYIEFQQISGALAPEGMRRCLKPLLIELFQQPL